mgnify:CR=1 FL=1
MSAHCTAFLGTRLLASGSLEAVALAARAADLINAGRDAASVAPGRAI